MSDDAPRRLHLSRGDRKLAGVCGGIAEYAGVDATVVRLLTVLACIVYPPTVIVYLAAILILPRTDRSLPGD